MPLMSIAAAAVFFYAKQHYVRDVARFNAQAIPLNIQHNPALDTDDKCDSLNQY
jgi:hypothetical protein